MTALTDIKVCSCGSCQEAMDNALGLLQARMGEGCITWFVGNVIALNTILSVMISLEAQVGSNSVARKADRLTLKFAEAVDDEMIERIAAIVEAAQAGVMN